MSDSPAPRPVAEGGTLLHVGMFKTGTTAIQGALKQAEAHLAAQDVALAPTDDGAHHLPALALLGKPLGWEDHPPDLSIWTQFADAVRTSASTRRVVSSEHFSGANDAQC